MDFLAEVMVLGWDVRIWIKLNNGVVGLGVY
jgi:hypothetical protein